MDPTSKAQPPAATVAANGYRLDEQVGYLLRRANQRHTALFAQLMPDNLTPTQFSSMVRLQELGPLSQNLLGRHITVDAATIKGVVDRLASRGLVQSTPHPTDGRRTLISLTPHGEATIQECTAVALRISAETLAPLSPKQQGLMVRLLAELAQQPEGDEEDA
jgi:DNA-binding MarR family transcriptional regulator